VDYSLLYRQEFSPQSLNKLPTWDLFISAFNDSERVRTVFDNVSASQKDWLIHPEYDFPPAEYPVSGRVFAPPERDESEFWQWYVQQSGMASLSPDSRICLDSTGFMRPHLMFAMLLFQRMGFSLIDVIYSDPKAYESGDKTLFTKGAVMEVRQVRGFEGVHTADATDDDLLVIGAGYDDELIRRVAEDKRAARKIEMFGLPSLQPHMYEENRLRAALAEESVGPLPIRSRLFAAANDPFETAQELSDCVRNETNAGMSNLYLSPLSTKAQVLGFAFFYLCECAGGAASIIFPFAEYYSRETTIGLARVWLFRFELDWIP
jgi:hypothetical protein